MEVVAGNLNQQSVVVFGVRLENNRLEPRGVLLLGDVCLEEFEAVVPKRLVTVDHWAFNSQFCFTAFVA
jgi:hypothetical protein